MVHLATPGVCSGVITLIHRLSSVTLLRPAKAVAVQSLADEAVLSGTAADK
jgi:hypothetical protein